MNNRFSQFFDKVSEQEKINFTRHLAVVIKSGLPVAEGLRIIKKQEISKTLEKVVDTLIEDVNNGKFMAESLKQYRHIFGDFFISIVQVGETSGSLGDNLMYLSEEMKKEKALRGRVRSAMIYPAILLFMTIAVSVFLTFFIFPKLVAAFQSLNVELPFATRVLITSLAFLQRYYGTILIAIIGFAIAAKFILQWRPVKYAVHMGMLYTPVLSGLIIDVNMANIARVLWILLKSGIKIVESLTITSQTLDNLVYKKAFAEYVEGVRRGEQLGNMLSKYPHYFPPILTSMIEIGENTGNLEENLAYLSSYYSEEVDNSLKDFVSILEPLILIFMGLMVGFVALAIITPIYSISSGLSK